jgi:hypothetical protein
MRSFPFFSITLAIAGYTAVARAQGDAEFQLCASAYEDAQRLQKKGQLLAAREEAATCAAPRCPSEIVTQCAKLLESIDDAIPTVVVAAQNDARDLTEAKLFIDGREVGARLEGLPVRLDPGTHTVRVAPTDPELEPRERTVTVRSGERNRRIDFVWGEQPSTGSSASIGFIPSAIAFALGGAGIVVGTTTGILALRRNDDLAERCGSLTTCPNDAQSDIDELDTLAVVSTTGFVIGGLGLATGIVLAAVAASENASDEPAVQPTADGFRIRF